MPHVWSSPATIDRSLRAMTEMLTVSLTPSLVAITLTRSEEHTSELQSQSNLVCRLLLEITRLNFMSNTQLVYSDQCNNDLYAYLSWLYETVLLLHNLLAADGSLYVHLDWRVTHYAIVLL